MLLLTLGILVCIEYRAVLSAMTQESSRATPRLSGFLLLVPAACVLFSGSLASFSLEAWGLCLVPAGLLLIFGAPDARRGAIELAVAGTVAVFIGRIAPEVLSADLAIELARTASMFLTNIGLPVISDGTRLYFGPYSAEVTEACAGMNSIFALTALSLLYLRQGRARPVWHMAVLALAVIPVAVVTNFTRIVLLVLSTQYVGDRFAQGVFHDAAGLFAFVVALLAVVLLDTGIQRFRLGRGRYA